MSLRYLIGAASILLLAVRADPVPNQYFLNTPHKLDTGPLLAGRLWRFSVGNDSDVRKEVLKVAGVLNTRLNCP